MINKYLKKFKPYRYLILVWSIAVLVFMLAAWPGWVSGDTIMMYQQAVSRQITDWHTPLLTFFWSKLKPTLFGPIIPFLLQTTFFWFGVLLITVWAYKRRNRWAFSIPIVALLLESTWVIAWVWKDSATVAIFVFVIGLLLFSKSWLPTKFQFISYLIASLLLGFSVSLRWYMAPSILLLWIGISLLYFPNSKSIKGSNFLKSLTFKWIVGLIAFSALGIGTNFFVYNVIKPSPLYPISGTMLLDISRVACNPEVNQDITTAPEYFPKELIHIVNDRPLCEFYNPVDFGALWGWPSIPPEHSYYSVPSNSFEMEKLQQKWISVIKEHPKALVIGRIQQAYFFLNSDAGFFYNPADKIEDHIAWNGNIGEGAAIGWPNNDSLAVVIVSFASATFSALSFGLAGGKIGLAWIVFFPLISGFILYRKNRFLFRKSLVVLAFPFLWDLNFSVAALAEDERYMLPAIVIGQLLLVFSVFYKEESKKSTNLQSNAQTIEAP